MTRQDVRYARPAAALFAAAAVSLVLAGPVARADITAAANVTSPAQSAVISGAYDSDGNASGFKVSPKGTAATNCPSGWQSITFTITGPEPTKTFGVTPPSSAGTWSGGPTTAWDTQPLKNGVYSIKVDVVEKDTISLQCNGAADNDFVTVKVANPPVRPAWETSPAPAGDGSGRVTLKWKKNAEVDVLEYQLIRTGPGGTMVAYVNAGTPSGQGCSYASSVYTCEDTSFGPDYSGSYDYRVAAVRERPAYNSNESAYTCQTVSKPCVVSSAGEIRTASLVAPTPTPEPTEQPTADPGSPPQPSAKPKTTTTNRPPTTRVFSFGSGGGGGGGFYSGTYSTSLPYQPRTLIIGGGRNTPSPSAQGYNGEVVSETVPDYRTIMLPVAGGMLAFLGAAHVRRLMFHL